MQGDCIHIESAVSQSVHGAGLGVLARRNALHYDGGVGHVLLVIFDVDAVLSCNQRPPRHFCSFGGKTFRHFVRTNARWLSDHEIMSLPEITSAKHLSGNVISSL